VDFTFTDEQKQLRKSVREFAEDEIAPHVMEWDESSRFPSEILPKLAEMGLLGVIFPEEYGGAGLGYIEKARSLVAYRARSGFRRRWHPHDRGPRQQGLDFEWLQNLHYQWQLRRHLRGHGRHR